MKKLIFIVFVLVQSCCYIACSYNTESDKAEINSLEKTNEEVSLVNNPTEDYIISCLKTIPNIMEVSAVTEENDPNGKLNKEGGYYSAVYFSVDLLDQEDISGENLIDKGTDAGGCIEAYKTIDDAINRNEYLKGFDNKIIFNSGYHTTIGTIVIRTSKHLTEEQKNSLEYNLMYVLTGGSSEDLNPVSLSENQEETSDSNAKEKNEEQNENSAKLNEEIEMPYNSDHYCGEEWTIQKLTTHLEELGFTNIVLNSYEPSDDDYKINIKEIYIEKGMFNSEPWEAGEKFDADAKIKIYYNESPLLTIDNCPDLEDMLTNKEANYVAFAEKYDGCYFEFDAYVMSHETYNGGIDHLISVAGENGLPIHIGNRTWDNSINNNVVEGDLVVVSGRVDKEWCEYYATLYIETRSMYKK